MKKLTQVLLLAATLLWFPADGLMTSATAQTTPVPTDATTNPATIRLQKRMEALQLRNERFAASRPTARDADPVASPLDDLQGKWEPRAPLPPGARERAFHFVIGDKMYVGTGRSYRGWANGFTNEDDVWAYDFAADTWEERSPFPGGPIRNAASFVIDGIAYIATAHDGGTYLDIFWKYDPTTDTWEELPPFPGGVRSFPVAFSIGGKGYVALGGVEPPTSFYGNDLWEYDPATQAWTQLADFPGQGRWRAFAFVIGDQAYVGGGNHFEVSTAGFSDCYRFDPADGSWTPIADFPEGWGMGCYAVAIDGKAYVGEGSNHGSFDTYRTKLWEYDPGTDAWAHVSYTPGPQMGRILAYSAAYDGKLYIGGGRTNSWTAGFSQVFGDFHVWDKDAAPEVPDYAYWQSLGRGEVDAEHIGIHAIRAIGEDSIWALPTATFTDHDAPLQAMLSSDGGAAWQAFTVDDQRGYISGQLHVLDSRRAWVMGSLLDGHTNVFRTQDGGQSWEKILDGADNLMNESNGIHFFDDEVGLCWGNDFFDDLRLFVYRTTDGGATWEQLDDPALPEPFSFDWSFTTSGNNNYAAVGDAIWIPVDFITIRSTDRGATWARTDYDVFDGSTYSIAFEDEQRGMTISDNWPGIIGARAFVTEDGGATWAELPMPFPTALSVTHVPGRPGAYLAYSTIMWDPRLAYTPNFGQDWVILHAPPALHAIQFLSPELAYAGGPLRRDVPEGVYRWKGDLSVFNRLYVKADATGANTGRTWQDAFTDLQDALAIAQPGEEIWVAQGLYTPAAPGGDRNATFRVDKDLRLYGGFAGTEASLEERGDPADHPTILSGDLNGDDVEDDFDINRTDNAFTVVVITADVTDEAVIDGFTIRNGHANGAGSTFSPDQSGGGMHVSGSPYISNCSFRQNYALFRGGGLHVQTSSAAEVHIDNSTFTSNFCQARGSGLSSFGSNLKFTGSTVLDNINDQQGGGLWFWGDTPGKTLYVADCYFNGNRSSFGGGLYAVVEANSEVLIANSTFEENVVEPNTMGWGQSGGGVLMIALGSNSNFSVSDCWFEGNISSRDGGGLFIRTESNVSDVHISVEDCHFEANQGGTNGNAAFLSSRGQNATMETKRCSFFNNTGLNTSGALLYYATAGAMGVGLVDSCHFENNTALYSGALEVGVGFNGGASNFRVEVLNSDFISNEAMEGGAITLWTDQISTGSFLIENCLIDNNLGSVNAGAILLHPHSTNFEATVKNSVITNNQSPDGSAIKAYQFINLPTFPANASTHLENCLVAGNSGGEFVMSLDLAPKFSLLNTTVAGNEGSTFEIGAQSSLRLQNSILYNPGYVEFIASSTSAFTSLGGNLIGDLSLDGQLVPGDKQGLDPLFASDGSYQLTPESPCVDAGVNEGVTAEFDLAGNPRIQGLRVDMGAYESPFVSSLKETSVYGEASVWPNPAGDFLFVQLPESGTAPFLLQLLDAQGRVLGQHTIREGAPLDVALLPAGLYSLKAVVDGKVFTGKFVKQ